MLSSGVPTREEYTQLESEPFYADLMDYSRDFERRCQEDSKSARSYSSKWVKDPFLQWSRRWEYVYTAQRLSAWLANKSGPLAAVDAGSGFTFFPFYLLRTSAELGIECFDNDPTAGEALGDAAQVLGSGPGFQLEDLESLGQGDETIDVVYSVSVIEHTPHPEKVIDEVHRVLKRGGLFICTFDISFEQRSPMHVRRVEKLVEHITSMFECSSDWEPIVFDSLPSDNSIVSTLWDSEAVKAGLPWRNPALIWLYDLLRGRFRSTLYRPMTFCCGAFTKPDQ